MILRILAVGDVVGAPGLTFLTERLRAFREHADGAPPSDPGAALEDRLSD